MRLFIAFWPDGTTLDAVCGLQNRLAGQIAGTPVAAERLHMTLAFLGEIAQARLASVMAIMDQLTWSGVSLTLNRVGSWIPPGVAWAGPSEVPLALTHIKTVLDERLRRSSFEVETRRYRPHVTLFRNVLVSVREHIPEIVWHATELALVKSTLKNGVQQYEKIALSRAIG